MVYKPKSERKKFFKILLSLLLLFEIIVWNKVTKQVGYLVSFQSLMSDRRIEERRDGLREIVEELVPR